MSNINSLRSQTKNNHKFEPWSRQALNQYPYSDDKDLFSGRTEMPFFLTDFFLIAAILTGFRATINDLINSHMLYSSKAYCNIIHLFKKRHQDIINPLYPQGFQYMMMFSFYRIYRSFGQSRACSPKMFGLHRCQHRRVSPHVCCRVVRGEGRCCNCRKQFK